MNSEELIKKITELGMTPIAFIQNHQEPEWNELDKNKIIDAVGPFSIADETTESSDEYTSEYWAFTKGVITVYFSLQGIYLQTAYYQGSYETEEYIPWKEVRPKNKIVYE